MIKKILKKKPSFETIEKLVTGLTDTGKKPDASGGIDPNGPSWLKYVAILTAALAGLAGFLVVKSSTLTNQSIFASNQAILAQAEASDAWAEYQADSIKARIVETQLVPSSQISAEDRAALAKTDEDLRGHQPQSKQLATDKTAERITHMNETQKLVDQKGLLEYASMAAQLGIVLASLAAMTKKPIALYAGFAVGIIGGLIAAYGLLYGILH